MAKELEFQIVGCIGELNINHKEGSLKVECMNVIESEYELYIIFDGTRKMFYCKFVTSNFSSELQQTDEKNDSRNTKIQISIWKILTFPFKVKDIFLSNKSLWAIGDDCLVDVKSHVENAVKVGKSNENNKDFMDVDADEEFFLEEFESSLSITSHQKHKLPNESVCIKCNLNDNSVLTCTKDLKLRSLHLTLLIRCLKSQMIKSVLLPDLPLTYDKTGSDILSSGTEINYSEPVVTFIHRRDFSFQGPKESRNNVLHKMLSTDSSSSSNCVCFIGHPEGVVVFFLGSKSALNDNFKVNSERNHLYDLKQPIVGIHFLEEITGVEGSGFILIIGAFGKLVFFTAEKCLPNSEEITIKDASIHIASLNLPTSIKTHLVYQNYIFHVSNSDDLWLSKFSKRAENNNLKKDFRFIQQAIIMHGIADITLLNEVKGLFLIVTMSGTLYLGEYAEKKEHIEQSATLPTLMNEIMHQSSVLKNLAFTASHQHKFFTALSTFASLKFSAIQKCNVSCSVTELDEVLKKFLVSINIKCSEKFDPEFWFVTASFYSHFQQDSALISKIVPFTLDQSINIEVQESLLCLPTASPFPIHIEVGLLLVLPEKLKTTPCFQIVSKKLPLYIRIQTLILNELYFIKNKSPYLTQSRSNVESSRNLISNIHSLSMSKPISKLLKIEHQLLSSHRQHFTFCLLATSAEEIVNCDSSDLPLADKLSCLLLEKSFLRHESGASRLVCRNQPMSLLVSVQENNVSIALHADSFLLLSGIRMAIMELLLSKQKKSNVQPSWYVQIPAAINQKCEKLSRDLQIMLDQDIETEDFLEKILVMYNNLRKEVSCVLPFC